jgi:putative transposase
MEELKPIAYSVRFSTINSLDIFVKKNFKELVINTLSNLKQEFSYTLEGYLVMPDHIALVVITADRSELDHFCEKFKRTISHKVMELLENDMNGEKRWLLFLINFINKENSESGANKIWNFEYNVKELSTQAQLENKLELIHYTPVLEGIVARAEDYVFSSAKQNVIEKISPVTFVNTEKS